MSLVGKPANMISFKVVRSRDGNGTVDKTPEKLMTTPVIRRSRRSDPSPIMRLTFPGTYTDEQVTQQLGAWGLSGYNVSRSDDKILATRADLQSSADLDSTQIKLTEDGVVAEVARSASPAPNPSERVKVAQVILRADKFDADSVLSWMSEHGINAETDTVKRAEGSGDYLVVRHAVPEGQETRTVSLDGGVSMVVVRDSMEDIPEGYVAVVNEACYGNWGWGHLDFSAAMADEIFSDAMDDAVYRLRSVLNNILLHSALPLAERKTLMTRALEQFNGFAISILDSLPRTVLVAVARSATLPKGPSMTTNTDGGASTQTAPSAAAEQPITRAAVAEMISEAIKAAVATPATATRDDGTSTAPAAAAQEPGAAPAAAPVSGSVITRQDLAAATADAVREAVTPLVERLAKVEGATTVRSDAGDQTPATTATKPAQGAATQAHQQDVFRGAPVFQGLRLRTGK